MSHSSTESSREPPGPAPPPAPSADAVRDYEAGVELLEGPESVRDYEGAMQRLARAAEAGHGNAFAKLATMLAQGLGGPPSPEAAFRCLQRGAMLLDPECICRMGSSYVVGHGTAMDVRLGVRMLDAAADGGYAEAQSMLGEILMYGRLGVQADPALACEYLERAAAQGDADAMAELGRAYAAGRGRGPDPEAADHWLRAAKRRGANVPELVATGGWTSADDEWVAARNARTAHNTFLIGARHFNAEQYAEAREWLTRALEGGLATEDFIHCAAVLSWVQARHFAQYDDAVKMAEAAVTRASEAGGATLLTTPHRRFAVQFLDFSWSRDLNELVASGRWDATRTFIAQKTAIAETLPQPPFPRFFSAVGDAYSKDNRPADARIAWARASQAQIPAEEGSADWEAGRAARDHARTALGSSMHHPSALASSAAVAVASSPTPNVPATFPPASRARMVVGVVVLTACIGAAISLWKGDGSSRVARPGGAPSRAEPTVGVASMAAPRVVAQRSHTPTRTTDILATPKLRDGEQSSESRRAVESDDVRSDVVPHVTVQYSDAENAETMDAVASALERRWERVSAPQRVPAGPVNPPTGYHGVRYYHYSDSVLARAVLNTATEVLARDGITEPLRFYHMRTDVFPNAPAGLVEVWVCPACARSAHP